MERYMIALLHKTDLSAPVKKPQSEVGFSQIFSEKSLSLTLFVEQFDAN
jgi:hypothetical protein